MFYLSASALKPIQLRLIAALAQTSKLQRAAEMLGIAQPAASRALAEIEKMAGTRLFIRHPKGMTITQAGQIVANKAHAILRAMHDLEESLSNIRAGLAGKVRIGSVTGPAIKYLVPAIRSAKITAPDLDITVEVMPSRQLLRELVSGQLDFVLARVLSGFDGNEFEITPLGDEQVSLLVRKNHPLTLKHNLRLSELSKQEWIVQGKDNPIREAVSAAFHNQGMAEPTNILNSSSLLFALGYLSKTDAIVTVSHEVTQLLIDDPISANFSQLKLKNSICVTPYYLMRLANHAETPAAQLISQIILSKNKSDRLRLLSH